MSGPDRVRGFTIVELVVIIALVAVLIGVVAPALAGARGSSRIDVSISNLRAISAAHQSYAGEWDGRQYTAVVDDLAHYSSLATYDFQVGEHPPILLGWGTGASGATGLYGYWFGFVPNSNIIWPINPTQRFGWFRLSNVKGLHDYLGGKFYDPVFYAPNDVAVYGAASQHFDAPYEFFSSLPFGTSPYWSSYCLSPAALFPSHVWDRFNPEVPSGAGSFGSLPRDFFECPGFAEALFPSLKTHIIEHNWNQNPPAECNPFFGDKGTYQGCEPYYFNHGVDSSPVTLFYDGSIRQLPNREVLAAEAMIPKGPGADGLWFSPSDDEFSGAGNLAVHGYYLEAGFDVNRKNDIGHHILTIDGIRGRDTLGK